jgi:hypothetical protein
MTCSRSTWIPHVPESCKIVIPAQLPLIRHLFCIRQTTPYACLIFPTTDFSSHIYSRKRSMYLRPPRPNFYCAHTFSLLLSSLTGFEDWFPNHCLVLHVLLLFSLLNPFVLPFGTLYFFVQTGVMKNQVSALSPSTMAVADSQRVSLFMSTQRTLKVMGKFYSYASFVTALMVSPHSRNCCAAHIICL